MNESLIPSLVPWVTLLLWLILNLRLRGRVFDMDPGDGSFFDLLLVYRSIYGAILIIGTIVPLIANNPIEYSSGGRELLALSAVYALFMLLWLTFCYEAYLHRPKLKDIDGKLVVKGKSPYTGWRYAITLALGIMSPILFALGLLELFHG